MPSIHIQPPSSAKPEFLAAWEEFSKARSQAINEYAALELALGELLGLGIASDLDAGTLLFNAIRDTRARSDVIRKLVSTRWEREYDVFVDDFLNLFGGVSQTRNKIVHQIQVWRTNENEFDPSKDVYLTDSVLGSRREIKRHDVVYFSDKVRFYTSLLKYFNVHLRFGDVDPGDVPGRRPWSEIFREKISYPPADDHPLHGVKYG